MNRYGRLQLVITVAAAFFLLTFGATSAKADTSTYTLNTQVGGLGGGPFGTVTVTLSSSTTAAISWPFCCIRIVCS